MREKIEEISDIILQEAAQVDVSRIPIPRTDPPRPFFEGAIGTAVSISARVITTVVNGQDLPKQYGDPVAALATCKEFLQAYDNMRRLQSDGSRDALSIAAFEAGVFAALVIQEPIGHYIEAGQKCVDNMGGRPKNEATPEDVRQALEDILKKNPRLGITAARQRVAQKFEMSEAWVRDRLK